MLRYNDRLLASSIYVAPAISLRAVPGHYRPGALKSSAAS